MQRVEVAGKDHGSATGCVLCHMGGDSLGSLHLIGGKQSDSLAMEHDHGGGEYYQEDAPEPLLSHSDLSHCQRLIVSTKLRIVPFCQIVGLRDE